MLVILIPSCISMEKTIEADMITIPDGSFPMGSIESDADPDEAPVHSVYVSSFRLSRFEVTQQLWKTVMGNNPSYHKGANLPVELISKDDAEEFVAKLNKRTGHSYRLPTETEWEYAAFLGQEGLMSPLESFAWYDDNSNGRSHKVGEKQPDALGLYDIIGNVNEWVQDSYEGKNYAGVAVIPVDSLVQEAVFRGGAFNAGRQYCRISNRNHAPSGIRNYAIGLRLAE